MCRVRNYLACFLIWHSPCYQHKAHAKTFPVFHLLRSVYEARMKTLEVIRIIIGVTAIVYIAYHVVMFIFAAFSI
jgi:hypothetical protein